MVDTEKDPFDEFEFKPLTEGLGFHKTKQQDSKIIIPKATSGAPVSLSKSMNATSVIPALPRKNNRELDRQEVTQKSSSTVDDILKSLNENKNLSFKEDLQPKKAKSPFSPSHLEISAALLDSMLVIASFLACLIIVLVITKIDLIANLLKPDAENMVYISLAALMGTLTWIYLVANRIFLGHTPGEWVFDQRLGLPEKLNTTDYSLGVAVRSLIIIATGFVTLPLLSMIFQKDFLGKFLGVELLKKN